MSPKGFYPRKSLTQRFWEKVDKTTPDDCWVWKAGKCGNGYGAIKNNHIQLSAHRVAWELTYGPIPKKLDVLHHCDTPLCVNPSHLFIGTNTDNMRDCINKGRNNPPIGENHPNSILTLSQVKEIKKAKLSQEKLANQYQVSRWTIRNILNGIVWKEA